MNFIRKNLAKVILCVGVLCGFFYVGTIQAQATNLLCVSVDDCEAKASQVSKDSADYNLYQTLAEYFRLRVDLDQLLDFFAQHNLALREDDRKKLTEIQIHENNLSNNTLSAIGSTIEPLLKDLDQIKNTFELYETAFLNGDTAEMMKHLSLLKNYYKTNFKDTWSGFIDNENLKALDTLAQEFQDLQLYIKRAGKSFDVLQRSKRKNMRQYRIVMEYVRTDLLTAESFQQQENEALGIAAEELKRNHESILFSEIEAGITTKRSQAGWSIAQEIQLYKDLITYFEKPLDNPVEELRQHTANGDILPGTRTDEGTDFVMENVLPGIINTILVVILSVSVLMIMAGGFMYVVSAGNQEQTKKALDMIIWTVIGTVAAVLVFSAVKFIIGIDFTDNEDKMPAVTDIVERDTAFDSGGNPNAGAALALGAGLAVQEGLNALGVGDNIEDDTNDDTAETEVIDADIEITNLVLSLPQGQIINDSQIPMIGPDNQREIPDLTASVETNLGDENTEVLEWRLQQESNSVVFNPSSKDGLKAVYSALTNVTGGDYRFSVKVQKKDDPNNFAWSDPVTFAVTEGALLKTAEYSIDGETWRELRATNEVNSIPFNYNGIYFRFGVKTSWNERIFDQNTTLTGYSGVDPQRSSYDDYHGYLETYKIDNPTSGVYTFTAEVINSTQAETRETVPFSFEMDVDRTLVLDQVDWGIFSDPYLPENNQPNTVCIKTNLGPYITVDWQMQSQNGSVVTPQGVNPFDPAVGLCATYPLLTPDIYTFSPVVYDGLDQDNHLILSSRTFEVRQDISLQSSLAQYNLDGVTQAFGQDTQLYLQSQSSDRKTLPVDFFVQTNLGDLVDVDWNINAPDTDPIFMADIPYTSLTGTGVVYAFDSAGEYLVSVTLTDQLLPTNTVTLNVWEFEVIPEDIEVTSLVVERQNQTVSIGDSIRMIDPLGDRRIEDIIFSAQTNLGNSAAIIAWELIDFSSSFAVANGTSDTNITGLNNLNPGIYTLKVLIQDTDYPDNQIWYSDFWFKIEEEAVITRAEYSPDGGLSWIDIDQDQNIFPFLANGFPFRFSVDSSWGIDGIVSVTLNESNPTNVSQYDSLFGVDVSFVHTVYEPEQLLRFSGFVTHDQTGNTMNIAPFSFLIDSFDRSVLVLSDDLGNFSDSFLPHSLNNSHRICVNTNLGQSVTMEWNLSAVQSSTILIPSLIEPFDFVDGYCAVYGTLLSGDYTFTYTVTDALDINNTFVKPNISFEVLDPLVVDQSYLVIDDGSGNPLQNGHLKVIDNGAGSYISEFDFLAVIDINHPVATLAVNQAEIQDLQGNQIHTMSSVETDSGLLEVVFDSTLLYDIDSYQILIELSSVYDPTDIQLVTMPFQTTAFTVEATDFSFISDWTTSIENPIPYDNKVSVLPFPSGNASGFVLRSAIQTDLPVTTIKSSYIIDSSGVIIKQITNNYSGTTAQSNWFEPNFLLHYGTYTWVIEVQDPNNLSDVQSVTQPIHIMPVDQTLIVQSGSTGPVVDASDGVIHTFDPEYPIRINSALPVTNPVPIALWSIKNSNGEIVLDHFSQFLMANPVSGEYVYDIDISSLPIGDDYTLEFAETSALYDSEIDIPHEGVLTFDVKTIQMVSYDGGLFATGFMENTQTNTVCIDTNLTDQVTVTWNLQSSTINSVISPTTTHAYDTVNGWCVDYTNLIDDNYVFEIQIEDANDSQNTITLVENFQVYTPIQINNSFISLPNSSTPINSGVVKPDYVYGSNTYKISSGLKVTFDTNATEPVAVTSVEIQRSDGSVVNAATILGNNQSGGVVTANFLPNINLGNSNTALGDYKIIATVAQSTNLSNSQTLELPFKVSTFVINNVIKEYYPQPLLSLSDPTVTVPNYNNIHVVYDPISYQMQLVLKVTLDSDIPFISYDSDGIYDLNGTLIPVLFNNQLNTNTNSSVEITQMLFWDFMNTNIPYGDYIWKIRVFNSQAINDYQLLEIPLSIVLSPTIDLLSVDYKNVAQTNNFLSAKQFQFKSNYFGQSIDTVTVVADPSSYGTTLSFPVTASNLSSIDFTDLPPGDYLSLDVDITDVNDLSNGAIFTNPTETLSAPFQPIFPMTIVAPDLLVKNGSGLLKNASNGHAGDFDKSKVLRVYSAFTDSNMSLTPTWNITDSTGTVLLDNNVQSISRISLSAVSHVYDIDISSLPFGEDYKLFFAESDPNFAQGALINFSDPLQFNVKTIKKNSYDGGLFATGFMENTQTNTVCIDTNLTNQVTVTWNLQSSTSNNVINPTTIHAYDTMNGWCADYGPLSLGNYTFDVTVTDNIDSNNFLIQSQNFSVAIPISVLSSFLAKGTTPNISLKNNNIKVSGSAGNYSFANHLQVDITTDSSESITLQSVEIQKDDGTIVSTLPSSSLTTNTTGGNITALFNGPLNFSDLGPHKVVATVGSTNVEANNVAVEIPFTVSTFEISSVDYEYYTNPPINSYNAPRISVPDYSSVAPTISNDVARVELRIQINSQTITGYGLTAVWGQHQLIDPNGDLVYYPEFRTDNITSGAGGGNYFYQGVMSFTKNSASSNLIYGDYLWRVKVKQYGLSWPSDDYQWLEIPITIVP